MDEINPNRERNEESMAVAPPGTRFSGLMDALSEPCRRGTVLALRNRGSLSVGQLSVLLSTADGYHTISDDPDEVRMSLAHVHLPKLHELGIIEYDHDGRQLRRGSGYDDAKRVVCAALTAAMGEK